MSVDPQYAEAEPSALRELLRLAGPTVAQMASYTLMQFIDTWMLARALGPEAPTAASNAGSLSYAFIGFGFGTLFMVNALASQAYGRKAFGECGRYLWQGIWFAIAYGLFLLPLIPLVSWMFGRFHHTPSMLAMERIYVHYMLASAGIKLVQTAYSQFLLATNRPTIVFISSAVGVLFNIVAAYAVVFGKLGFPAMGVRGAAIAQIVGMTIELLVLVGFTAFSAGDRVKFGGFDWRFRLPESRKLITLGSGSGAQMVAEIAAWSLFMNWVMGQLGASAMAAMAFMLRYLILSFLPTVGISTAVTALVGRYIGMGRPDLAVRRAHLGYKVALTYLGCCGLLYFFARHALIAMFTHDPEVIRLGSILLIFAAFYQLFDGMYIIYCGALRGAGDTLIPALVCALLCWTIMLGGGFMMAHFFPQLSVTGPWSVTFLYGVTLGLFMFFRFRRGGWSKIRVDAEGERPLDAIAVAAI